MHKHVRVCACVIMSLCVPSDWMSLVCVYQICTLNGTTFFGILYSELLVAWLFTCKVC